MGPAFLVQAQNVRDAIANAAIVRRIYFFDEIGSTSDWAKALIRRANGSADLEGTLVVANSQIAGRGRFDRRWHATAGKALLFSLILRESLTESSPALLARQLSIAAPVAGCRAIAVETGLSARIKYPNDVLLSGRKCCGILIESVTASKNSFAVLGVGINVNQSADELPSGSRITPTSIALESGKQADLLKLLNAFLESLTALLDNPEAARQQMNLLCETLGNHVRIDTAYELVEGVAAGVTAEGALIVRTAIGIDKVIHSGDVVQVTRQ